MNKKEKQIQAFVEQAQEVAKEWTLAEINDEDTHPKFSNQMYLIHELAKKVINAEEDKEAD